MTSSSNFHGLRHGISRRWSIAFRWSTAASRDCTHPLSDPKVLILDEATSALDDESQAVIQANMASIARGRTVITIAHRLSTVRDCDRIIVLHQGTIVEQGSHQQLLAYGKQYKQLWQLQQELKQEEASA